MEWAFYFAAFFVWVAVVWVLRCRRYALLQNICDSALTESDHTRRQTLVWFAHYLLTSLELNFEVKAAMSFRGLLATCVLDRILPFSCFSYAFRYAIPSISSVLVATGGFQRNAKRRYADMELLIREFNENCCNSG